MLQEIRPALVSLAILTLLTGLAYPLAMTGIAQAVFPYQANGSVITVAGKEVGSELIGQPFDDPKYFWGRASHGPPRLQRRLIVRLEPRPHNPALLDAVQARAKALTDADPGNQAPIPVDLVTASASGLDPHITPAAAEYQVARVARARGLSEGAVRDLVAQHTEKRQLGLLGEPRVHVLRLNLALDAR